MHARTLALAALLAVATLAHGRAEAAWSHDPYNGNNLVCGAAGGQTQTQAIADGSGGMFVTWIDARAASVSDVYVQHVSASGASLWTADGVAVCTAASDQEVPSLVLDGSGGVIVMWEDGRLGGGNYDIYAQHLNAAGTPTWTANGVGVCTAAGQQTNPRMVADGAGGAIIVWTDSRTGTNSDVYAQRVNASGTPLWTANGIAVTAAANDQWAVDAVSDGAGGAIVTWHDIRSGTEYDIYAQRILPTGLSSWTAGGLAVCTATGNQYYPSICSDGAGGATISWQDARNGTNYDIYAQHLSSGGIATWPTGGQPVSTVTGNQLSPHNEADGYGGAFVTWSDYRSGTSTDVYIQRLTAGGGPLWTTDGVPVCAATGDQSGAKVLADNAGGAFVLWGDSRYGGTIDLFGQHVNANGSQAWTYNGVLVCAAAGGPGSLSAVTDNAGGLIAAWSDNRSGINHVYAQRLDGYGQLGDVSPSIASIRDLPNDQGGFVKVSWNASWVDAAPNYSILDYRVWRSVPPNTATNRARLARGVTTDADEAASTGRMLAAAPGGTTDAYFWEYVGSQAANQFPGYSMVAATTSDSVAAGNPRTAFMVEARTSTYGGTPHWFSAPDSGYSVDNLAPVTPAPFAGNRIGAATALHWNPNREADLAGYRLYRGTTPGFVPGPGNLVAALADTGYTDPTNTQWVYALTAADVHGNESRVATLAPGAVSDIDGGDAPRAFFELASANPSRRGAAVALRFGLARSGRASLALYDAAGRRVRVLADGERAAGAFALAWDGRDDAGAACAPGLYFARLETPGFAAARRIVRVE